MHGCVRYMKQLHIIISSMQNAYVCAILADIAIFFHNLIKHKSHGGIYLNFSLVSLLYLLLKYNNNNR